MSTFKLKEGWVETESKGGKKTKDIKESVEWNFTNRKEKADGSYETPY